MIVVFLVLLMNLLPPSLAVHFYTYFVYTACLYPNSDVGVLISICLWVCGCSFVLRILDEHRVITLIRPLPTLCVVRQIRRHHVSILQIPALDSAVRDRSRETVRTGHHGEVRHAELVGDAFGDGGTAWSNVRLVIALPFE